MKCLHAAINPMRSICALFGALFALAAGAASAAPPVAAPAATPGYFLVFEFAAGRIQAPSVMTTAHYVPNRDAMRRGGWRLRMLDASGAELMSTTLDDPLSLAQPASAQERDLRLVARVPQWPTAARFELLDRDGVIAWQHAIDGDFRRQAAAQAAQAAASAATAQAPQPVAADNVQRRLVQFQERRREAEIAAALATLNDFSATPDAHAQAASALRGLQTPLQARLRKLDRDHAAATAAPRPGPLVATATTAPTSFLLSGTVSSTSGPVINDATLRLLRSDTGAYVVSTVADPDTGRYELRVPAGTYDLEFNVGAREYVEDDKVLYLAPQRVTGIVVNADTTRDIAVTPPTRTLTLAIRRAQQSYYYSGVAIELSQGGKAVARQALSYVWDKGVANSDGTATTTWNLLISPGTYDVTVEATSDGVAAQTFSGINLSQSDQTLQFDTGNTTAWNGRLIDSQGNPIANTSLTSFDGLFHYRGYAQTDANGNFSLAVAPGWFVQFPARADSNDGPLRYDVATTSGLPSVVQTPAIALQAQVNASITRLYTGANSDGNRLRLLFIGNGYTTQHETFTDSNGNGVWDGVLWYDLNQNGVYDSGDIVQLYGNAKMPASGSVPGADNEPFVDLNGDHFPNFDDGAAFLLNAQQYARSLLSGHYWSEHRAAFQIDAAFVPSNQAGITITDKNGKTIYTADTAFAGSLETVRNTLSVDRTRALQVAEQLSPGFDCLVVMLNEPIAAGRANESIGGAVGFQIETGGVAAENVNAPIIPHEMGHFVGYLADEYSEFYTAPPDPADFLDYDGGINETRSLDLASVPWSAFLAPSQALPDLLPHTGIGVFEGANYYYGGFYRPTWASMMRYQYNGEPFNAPSMAALDAGLLRFTQPYVTLNQHGLAGSWYNPKTSGQGLLIDVNPDLLGPGQGVFFAGWFTYDTSAGGEDKQRWYTLQGSVNNTDAAATMPIYASYGGNFAAPPKVAANPVGKATIQFANCNQGTLAYQFDDGRTGAITLTRGLSNLTCTKSGDAIGDSLYYYDPWAGTWYDPSSSGQGLIFDIHSNQFGNNETTPGLFFGAWYTFLPNGQSVGGPPSQRWYTLQGSTPQYPASVNFTNLGIYQARGGVFDSSAGSVTTPQVGTANIVATGCSNVTLNYNFTAGSNAGTSGAIKLVRLGAVPLDSCN